MITAAKRLGLYSAFRACSAMFFRSSLHSRFTVATTFWGGRRWWVQERGEAVGGGVWQAAAVEQGGLVAASSAPRALFTQCIFIARQLN